MRLALHDIAHSRAGDKGQLITLSLIPYDPSWFSLLRDCVQPAQVREHLRDRLVGEVTRYEMPKLAALMFVCGRASTDTVTTSLHIDGHGKTLSSALLQLEIEVPDDQARELGLMPPRPAASGGDRR